MGDLVRRRSLASFAARRRTRYFVYSVYLTGCQIAHTSFHLITWDEPKRRVNLRKHKIDLAELEKVFDYPMITVEDDRERYGELRLQSLGRYDGRVVFWFGLRAMMTLRI